VAPACTTASAHSTQLMGPLVNHLEDLHTNSNYHWGWKRQHPTEIEALYQKTYQPLLRAIYNCAPDTTARQIQLEGAPYGTT
jgi:hypothetical protein